MKRFNLFLVGLTLLASVGCAQARSSLQLETNVVHSALVSSTPDYGVTARFSIESR